MNRATLRYQRLLRAWAVVFAAVGAAFVAAPLEIGAWLTVLANAAGLPGRINAPAPDLWFVLALSLMVAVTTAAWAEARAPRGAGYSILLAAKLSSTLGFAVLALRQAPAWWLCALGDGCVALTIIVFRPASPGESLASALAARWRGQAPFYEVWFGKVDIAPGRALWFRYTLLDGAAREAATWAVLFDDGGRRLVAGKDVATLTRAVVPAAAASASEPVFTLGDAWLDPRHAVGHAGEIRWDLRYDDRGRRFDHVPAVVKRLRLAKSTLSSCCLDGRFSGVVRCGDTVIEVAQSRGMIGHIYGRKHAHAWAWAHCSAFAEQTDVVFEGLSARLALAGRVTPPLSSFVLFVDERRYAFAGLWRLLRAKSVFTPGAWTFGAHAGGVTLEGSLSAPSPEAVALVTYTDTDGAKLWCHNSKLASLRLHLVDRRRGLDATYTATGRAAFEVVTRDPPERTVTL